MISAVLRSWEQRFGAVGYEVAPRLVRLTVARPPDDLEQALPLAAELYASTAGQGDLARRPLRDAAEDLLAGDRPAELSPSEPKLTRGSWDIGW